MTARSNTVRVAGMLVLLACAGVAVRSAVRQQPGQGRATAAPPVPPAYAFLYSTDFRTRDAAFETARQTLPFTSMTISRKGCFGTCPIYTATLNLDGTARYTGERYVDRIGRFSGLVYLGDFAQLALNVERSGFMTLASRFTAPWTDDETVVVTVTPRTGSTVSVSDYGRFGPPELWTLEQALDGVVGSVKWTAMR